MQSPNEIKRHIKSVKSIHQITKAMKMVSAAKARKATERITAALPYAIRMRRMLRHIVYHAPSQVSAPLLQPHQSPRSLYIVFTGERGLCGSFNTSIIKEWERHRQEIGGEADLIVFGRWGVSYYRAYQIPYKLAYPTIGDDAVHEEIRIAANHVMELFSGGDYHAIYLVYSRFINTLRRQIKTFQLLPFEQDVQELAAADSDDPWIFEPKPADLFDYLLPKYVATQLAAAYLDNRASEFAARMMAMDSATKNADELISALTLQYNRARQARITQEIAEIIGGTLGTGQRSS